MTQAHKNHMNGQSFDINNPLTRLRVAASSCFFGEPRYYQEELNSKSKKVADIKKLSCLKIPVSSVNIKYIDKVLGRVGAAEWANSSPAKMLENTIDSALEHDIEATLAFAVELRTSLKIRRTPQVIMVRAANHNKIKGTGLLAKYSNQIMKRLDDAMIQTEYQFAKFGKPIPSRLKRSWARRLEGANTYELAKYRREGHGVNIYDLVNICHPRPSLQPALNDLMKGNLKLGGRKKDIKTWESIRANGGSWKKAAEVMGHMALLRNLRNLTQAGIVENYIDKLQAGVAKGNQLPFRYFSAYKAIEDIATPKVLEAVEDCIEQSILSGLPHFNGKAIHLSDNSGSAWASLTSKMGTMKVADIGNLMSVIGAKISDEGYVGVFGDRLITTPVKHSSRTFDVLKNISNLGKTIGKATENGIWLFWEQALAKKEHWDHIFVWSDMQAGHGGMYGLNHNKYKNYNINGRFIDVPKLISDYRKTVNPNVMVHLVQTAGYEDVLVPEFYDKTFLLGGWSENVFHFAAEMNEIFG